MRFFLVLFLVVILVFIGVQAYGLYTQEITLQKNSTDLSAQAAALLIENRAFTEDINYLKSDHNAAKELQSKFNYRRPDEKMFMLAPAEPSSQR